MKRLFDSFGSSFLPELLALFEFCYIFQKKVRKRQSKEEKEKGRADRKEVTNTESLPGR